MGRLVTLTEAASLMTLVNRVKEHVDMPRGKPLSPSPSPLPPLRVIETELGPVMVAATTDHMSYLSE